MNRKYKQLLSSALYHATKITPLLHYIPDKNDTIVSGISKVAKGALEASKDYWKITPNIANAIKMKNLKRYQLYKEMYNLDVDKKEDIYEEKFSKFLIKIRIENEVNLFFGANTVYNGELSYGNPYLESRQDLEKLSNIFWREYNNCCSVFLKEKFVCGLKSISPNNNPTYGQTAKIADELSKEIIHFRKADVPRTWLFLGPPGLGKTQVATQLAKKTNGRLLRIESHQIDSHDIDCIANLLPDIVLFDDIDQISNSVLLPFLERMKEAKVNMLLTSNSIDKMSEAVLRPGRIDKIIEFHLPDKIDRLEVIRSFQKEFGLNQISEEQIEFLAETTDKMSHAYIREIMIRLCYDSFETVRESIVFMHKIRSQKEVLPTPDKSE